MDCVRATRYLLESHSLAAGSRWNVTKKFWAQQPEAFLRWRLEGHQWCCRGAHQARTTAKQHRTQKEHITIKHIRIKNRGNPSGILLCSSVPTVNQSKSLAAARSHSHVMPTLTKPRKLEASAPAVEKKLISRSCYDMQFWRNHVREYLSDLGELPCGSASASEWILICLMNHFE